MSVLDTLWGLVSTAPAPWSSARRQVPGSRQVVRSACPPSLDAMVRLMRSSEAEARALLKGRVPGRNYRGVTFTRVEGELQTDDERLAMDTAQALADRYRCPATLWWAGNDGEGACIARKPEYEGKGKRKPAAKGKGRGKAETGCTGAG